MTADAPTVEIRIVVDRVDRRVLIELLAKLLVDADQREPAGSESGTVRLEEVR